METSESVNSAEAIISGNREWYQRSGFASLDDFQSSHWREVFGKLEEIQSEFLSQEKAFRSPEYRWPRDPLHFVARPWEYAYTLCNLRDWQGKHPDRAQPKVMDFGSGVTFFPFALARHKMNVVAVDADPIVQKDLEKAARVVSASPGAVSVVLSRENTRLPIESASIDCICSISVLEHVEDPISAVKELTRVLTPHGLLVLTFDVCFRGNSQILPGPYLELTTHLRSEFELVWPEVSIHPSRMLSCYNGPYPLGSTVNRRCAPYRWAKSVLRRGAGESHLPFDCAFMAMVLKKK